MKTYSGVLAALFTCALVAGAQTTDPGTGASVSQGNAANPPGTNLPPGLEKRDQLPPGLQYRDRLPPGLTSRTNDSLTGFGATNQLGTNQFGIGIATNRFAATNDSGVGITPLRGTTNQLGSSGINRPRLAPTGPAGGTNRIYSTNPATLRTNNLTPPRS